MVATLRNLFFLQVHLYLPLLEVSKVLYLVNKGLDPHQQQGRWFGEDWLNDSQTCLKRPLKKADKLFFQDW